MSLVLIVEDEYGAAEVLSLILNAEGFVTAIASNGRDAMLRIAAARPDVVVSDYMMPVMDGAQLGRTIRSDADLRKLPFILTSALEEARVRQVFDGYDAFLQKPFTADALIGTIHRLLQRGPLEASPPAPVRRVATSAGPVPAHLGEWLMRSALIWPPRRNPA